MQRKLKCPKCHAKCLNYGNLKTNPSNICIADGPQELSATFPNDKEFKLRIWACMRPPRISETLAAVKPERLEIVRDLLQGRSEDKPCSVHVDSKVNLQLMRDGSIRKVLSRTEWKCYPPRNRPCDDSPCADPTRESSEFTFNVHEALSSTKK